MRYSAWADDGEVAQGCVVADLSDTGARLEIDDPGTLPDMFTLTLAGPGHQRRQCRVVWRRDQEIGVTFETPGPKARRAGTQTARP